MFFYEMNFGIRFKKVWNGFWNPFHKKNNLWNEFRNPFQKCMKRISKSVSQKKIKICETDFRIRFRNVWNRFRNPFHKKKLWNGLFQKSMKWISNSISEKYETDYEIRFTKNILKFVKRISKSVSEKYETDSEIRF